MSEVMNVGVMNVGQSPPSSLLHVLPFASSIFNALDPDIFYLLLLLQLAPNWHYYLLTSMRGKARNGVNEEGVPGL